MQRLFITGATGFIGSAVVGAALSAGKTVAVLQRTSSVGSRIEPLRDQLVFIPMQAGDVRSIEDRLRQFQADCIIHLGWGGIAASDRNSISLQMANLENTLRLAEIAAELQIHHFIGAGSQAEYGPQAGRITETSPVIPKCMYGAAKLAASILTRQVCEQARVLHSWVRVFSTYGPDDNPDWMLPTLVRKLMKRERPELTYGEQLWDFLYVDDAATAFIAVADRSATGVFNLGSGKALPLRQVIEMVRDQIDPTLPLGFGEVPYRPNQVMHLEADIARLESECGWTPSQNLNDGLRKVVQFEQLRHSG